MQKTISELSVIGRRAAGRVRRTIRGLRPDPTAIRDRLDEQHMRMLFAFLLEPDSNCVDVGANRGTVLAELVRVAPNGSHVAFEPLPHLAAELHERFPNVDVRAAAVADEAGESSFEYASLDAYSGLRQRSYPPGTTTTQITVPVVTLDDELGDRDVTLLKIDVEGGEMGVLNGARKTLERCRPVVVFEHGAGAREFYGTAAADVWQFFNELGMRIFDTDGNGPLSLDDFARESSTTRWNWVAH
jgi:FkbM family methyltransferase